MSVSPRTMIADLLICLRFFSRLPIPSTARETALGPAGLTAAAAMMPLAGAIIALFPAGTLIASDWCGLPHTVAAALAVGTGVVVTGALHEDGLADCADGFGGGRSRERKLAIMRDSRLGTYGVCSVALSLLLRVVSLAAISSRSLGIAVVALIFVAALSRAACLVPIMSLPAARAEGLGASLALPRPIAAAGAASIVVVLGFGATISGWSASQVSLAIIAAGAMALLVSEIARRQIGGQTGDVAGAVQQVAEIAALVVLSAMPVAAT